MDLESSFHHCGSLVKLVQASLSIRGDSESIFHHCGGPMKLLYVCFCVRRYLKAGFTTVEVM